MLLLPSCMCTHKMNFLPKMKTFFLPLKTLLWLPFLPRLLLSNMNFIIEREIFPFNVKVKTFDAMKYEHDDDAKRENCACVISSVHGNRNKMSEKHKSVK